MASDPRDYKLDIAGLSAGENAPQASGSRPYLRVLFACCNVYLRLYRSPDGASYHGACPKCFKPVRFAVAPGGTSSRDFVVY